MFETLRQSLKIGVVTTSYPETPPEVSNRARGKPEIDWANWKDARPAAAICPTGAIEFRDEHTTRTATLDLGKCIFCGLCADVDKAIRITTQCELAARRRASLQFTARYQLARDGSHERLIEGPTTAGSSGDSVSALGEQLQKRIHSVLGRSLHIRQVDAGSCNGCEIEIHGLNSPVYDLERFGIHFVASPRHADMLLVTGQENLRRDPAAAARRRRRRLWLQWRHLRRELRHVRGRGFHHPGGRLHSRLSPKSPRAARRNSTGNRANSASAITCQTHSAHGSRVGLGRSDCSWNRRDPHLSSAAKEA